MNDRGCLEGVLCRVLIQGVVRGVKIGCILLSLNKKCGTGSRMYYRERCQIGCVKGSVDGLVPLTADKKSSNRRHIIEQ